MQALGPLAALFLSRPSQVQRSDGVKVELAITGNTSYEVKAITKLFFSRQFLLIAPLIAQGVYTEAVMFTFEALWLSVQARALGSFLSRIAAIIAGNILGTFLDSKKFTLKARARGAYVVLLTLHGAWWIWATVLVTRYRVEKPTYDWIDKGFGRTFALFLFWVASFQLKYMYL